MCLISESTPEKNIASHARLTYRSTEACLVELIHKQLIFAYQPEQTTRPAVRRLFMTDEAYHKIMANDSPIAILGGDVAIGRIRAAFTGWVLGDWIYKSGKNRLLKDLDPPPEEIWEIRIFEPRPQYRAICRFIECDTILVTDIINRDDLGEKGSQQWRHAMHTCERRFLDLRFPSPCFVGDTIHDYVSSNCQEFPIKEIRKEAARERRRKTSRQSASSKRSRKKKSG